MGAVCSAHVRSITALGELAHPSSDGCAAGCTPRLGGYAPVYRGRAGALYVLVAVASLICGERALLAGDWINGAIWCAGWVAWMLVAAGAAA